LWKDRGNMAEAKRGKGGTAFAGLKLKKTQLEKKKKEYKHGRSMVGMWAGEGRVHLQPLPSLQMGKKVTLKTREGINFARLYHLLLTSGRKISGQKRKDVSKI